MALLGKSPIPKPPGLTREALMVIAAFLDMVVELTNGPMLTVISGLRAMQEHLKIYSERGTEEQREYAQLRYPEGELALGVAEAVLEFQRLLGSKQGHTPEEIDATTMEKARETIHSSPTGVELARSVVEKLSEAMGVPIPDDVRAMMNADVAKAKAKSKPGTTHDHGRDASWQN